MPNTIISVEVVGMSKYRTDFSINEVIDLVKTSDKQLSSDELAKILNVSKRTLLRRCKEYGGYRNLVKNIRGNFNYKVNSKERYINSLRNKNCKYCGKEYEGHFNSSFCSQKCKKQYTSLKKHPPKECKGCGKLFKPVGRELYCSRECSVVENGNCKVCGKYYEKSVRDRSHRRKTPTCSSRCSNIYLSKAGREITIDDIKKVVNDFQGQPTLEEVSEILKVNYPKVVSIVKLHYGSYKDLVRKLKGNYNRYSTNYVPKDELERQERLTRLHQCLYCGEEFKGHFNSRYCSSYCKDKAKYEKIVDKKECIECGKMFDVAYRYRDRLVCHDCAPPTSRDAYELFKLLDDLGFKGIREKTFDGMVSPYSGNKLRVDYYIPSLNLAVEYNGRQHYMFIEHYHKDLKGFKESRLRDKAKRDFLIKNGIPLIIWRYDEPVTKEKVKEKFGRFIN